MPRVSKKKWKEEESRRVKGLDNYKLFHELLNNAFETDRGYHSDYEGITYEILYDEIVSRLDSWLDI